jgi:hypothetical protein
MKWEYKGRKLNPLHIIIWRLFWWPIFKASAAITCFIAWMVFGRHTAECIWRETK